VSSLGSKAFVVALSWLTVKSYGAAGIAALALSYGLPQFFLQLVGGTAADRMTRRRLFLLAETGFLLVALLAWLSSVRGMVPLWLLVGINFCNGAISSFALPARTALVGEMVPKSEQVEAQQLYSACFIIGNIFGPALGGVLMSIGQGNRSHEEIAFFFNVLSCLPLLALIPCLPFGHSSVSVKTKLGSSLLRSVGEGVKFVRDNSSLRVLLQLLAVVMLLGMPFQTLLPIFVHGHHAMGGSQSHREYAALLSAVGFGGLAGSLLGLLSGRTRQPGLPLLLAAAGLGVSIFLLALSDVLDWASLAAFLAGMCSVLAVNLDIALVQAMTPADLQGRVSAITSLGKGLHSFSAAAASALIAFITSHSSSISSGYGPVQISMALALFLAVIYLRGPLLQLNHHPAYSTK